MSTPLQLNLETGSVSCRFEATAARDLQAALHTLMANLKLVASASNAGGRATPQPPLEYRYSGVFLELFCNPNIWPSPFAARTLLTLRDEKLRLTVEVPLSQLLEDLAQYLEQF
jgi:hypothetical protein